MLRIRHSLFISRMHSFIRLPLLSPTVLTNHREIHPLALKLPPAIDRALSDKPERANDWQGLHEWEGPQLSSAAARLKRIKIDRRLSLSLYAAGSDIPDCTSGIQAKIVERCFFWHMSTPQSTSRPTQRRHSWVQLLRARWHHIYTDKERRYALKRSDCDWITRGWRVNARWVVVVHGKFVTRKNSSERMLRRNRFAYKYFAHLRYSLREKITLFYILYLYFNRSSLVWAILRGWNIKKNRNILLFLKSCKNSTSCNLQKN